MERALKEGKKFDEQLTQLAEKEITPQLLEAEAGESEDEEEESGGGGRSRSGRGSKEGHHSA